MDTLRLETQRWVCVVFNSFKKLYSWANDPGWYVVCVCVCWCVWVDRVLNSSGAQKVPAKRALLVLRLRAKRVVQTLQMSTRAKKRSPVDKPAELISGGVQTKAWRHTRQSNKALLFQGSSNRTSARPCLLSPGNWVAPPSRRDSSVAHYSSGCQRKR